MRLLSVFALLCAFVVRLPANDEPCGAFYSIPFTEAFEPTALILPNTSPFNQVDGPRLVVESLGNMTGVTKWQGMACDEVWLPAGSKIGVKAGAHPDWQDYKSLESFVWTLRPDGFLDWSVR